MATSPCKEPHLYKKLETAWSDTSRGDTSDHTATPLTLQVKVSWLLLCR